MRQQLNSREHFWRGNAAVILIVALQLVGRPDFDRRVRVLGPLLGDSLLQLFLNYAGKVRCLLGCPGAGCRVREVRDGQEVGSGTAGSRARAGPGAHIMPGV